MSARADILARLAAARYAARNTAPPRAPYAPPHIADLVKSFIAKAKASDAEIHAIESVAAVPETAMAILSAANAPLRLHIAEGSPLRDLPWHRKPGLTLDSAAPGAGDAALSSADFGIAETGTLAFASGPGRPSSWHFLPQREFVLLLHTAIVPALEDAFARFAIGGAMPATVNLVTGPSRTADIEQTIERGAHGPRAVHILLAGAL